MKADSPYHQLRQAEKGIAQQMILWGHDAKHPQGNALQRFGLSRVRSTGLQGTSCYLMDWQGGVIQLHGALISWHPSESSSETGCLYCRRLKRLRLWSDQNAPIPGKDNGTYGPAEIIWQAFQPLLAWIIQYEKWVIMQLGEDWRRTTWRAQFSLVKKTPWLPPPAALHWWCQQVTKQASS